MQYTAPHYYSSFHCIGSACPDTCCAGWQIQIDPASLKKYRHMPGPVGSRLQNEIDWKQQCFRRYEGRCAFLNEENLCDLYLEGGGKHAFCRTCRVYPRHMEEYEGLRELSLSLSCPPAAGMILGCGEPVRFLHAEKPARQKPDPDFDFLLFTKLTDVRDLLFSFLQNRSQPLSLRLSAALALAHDLQQRIDRQALFAVDELLARYGTSDFWQRFGSRLKDALPSEAKDLRFQTLERLFHLLFQMESLRPDWKLFVRKALDTLKNTEASSPEEDSAFQSVFSPVITEQLMMYFVYTYFCGAVYNENAWGKMKFSFASTVLIRELVRARWLDGLADDRPLAMQDTPGGRIPKIVLETAWRYAREMEHSDLNKDRMEQLLEDEELFGLEKLLTLA